jgi:hypothetical protein
MTPPSDTPPKKVRRAELISPPNTIKEKVGSGGLDEAVLQKAQAMLENNTVDFAPIASMLLESLNDALQNVTSGALQGEPAIEAMIYPAMQLKAQGTMFHYALVTEISDILVNFLETVTAIDKDVLEIVSAHRKAIAATVAGGIKGDGGKTGAELRDALMDACNRFYRTRAG